MTLAVDRNQAAVGGSAPPRSKPIKAWACLGAFFVALEIYIFAAWIISGNAKRTPTGPTQVPTWMKTVGDIWQAGGIVVCAIFIYFIVVRSWRKVGHITLDGILVFVFLSLYWQDPLPNYLNNWLTYNPMFVNFGSWASDVPGWVAPRSHLFPEPILLFGPIYIYTIYGLVVLGNYLMGRARARWPSLSTFGLVGSTLAFMIVADIIVETVWMLLGWWAWGGSISWLTINHGHYYQYPIYEGVFWGATWTAWSCLRYFVDDKGRTVVERGIDDVRVRGWKLTWLRGLALGGICNVIYLACYIIPINWFGMHAAAWPADVQSRSYLTDGLCGPGTTYACSSPAIPIPRTGSAHVAPDGQLVVPRK
jgi:hypothetical protein